MRDVIGSVFTYKKIPKIQRSFIKTKKFIATLAVALGITGIGLSSLVFASNTVAWDGQQGTTNGVFNSSQCDAQNDPGGANAPYIFWVFTLGGGSNTVTSATLTLGGSGSGTYPMSQNGNEMRATTPFFNLSTLTAHADYVGTLGTGNANLVISHGCVGGTSVTATTLHDANHNPVTVGSSVPLGSVIHDSATVTLTPSGVPTGNVTFTFYTNGTCSGDGAAAGTVALDGSNPGVAHPSSSEGPLTPGNYSFKASWPGQTGYTGSTSDCENFTVNKAQLGINTTVHSDSPDQALVGNLSLGQGAHDSATVTGGVTGFSLPNVTFYFFDKSVSCTNGNTAGGTQLNTVAPDGTTGVAHPSTSETNLAAGNYNFMAIVAGDSNYIGSTGNCEPFTVNKAQLSISTAAHNAAHQDITNGSVALGSVTHDTATISGAVAGFTLPTSVSFTLTTGYTNSCATGSAVANNGTEGSAYKSADSSALGAGSYAYRASIGGNDNYIGADGLCEPFTVNKAQLGITTDIHNANHQIVTSVSQGTVVHDTATVTGGVSGFTTPNVTFTFYTNNSCSGTGTNVANTGADGSAVRSADSAPLAIGFYSYSASVPGSDNYLGATAICEPLTVSGFWCSPGFWATAISQNRTGVLAYLTGHGVNLSTKYSVAKAAVNGAALSKKAPSGDPTISTVLLNPSVYGGPAFNTVADYIAQVLGWGGTQLTGENCPLDAHGNFTLTVSTLTI